MEMRVDETKLRAQTSISWGELRAHLPGECGVVGGQSEGAELVFFFTMWVLGVELSALSLAASALTH